MFLAYADNTDTTNANLKTGLICAGILILVTLIGFVPVAIAWSRRHRRTELITAAALLWGLLAAGSLAVTTVRQLNWSQERQRRIESGYFDPADTSDAPTLPIPLWGGLGLAYVGLIAWGISQKRPSADNA